MTQSDSIVYAQLPAIRQILADETWLEAERRGCRVNADDCVVRENVCLVVLRIGARLRESAERVMGGGAAGPVDRSEGGGVRFSHG